MQKKKLSLEWSGTFIELCLGRITIQQMEAIAASGMDLSRNTDLSWYENMDLLQSVFDVPNWWSIDDLDHAMGLVFEDRDTLVRQMASINVAIDRRPVTVDPDALQLSIYAPEAIADLAEDDRLVVHGATREATLHLDVEFEPPFDPSQITLSLLRYAQFGLILIDLDYDGYDDLRFTWGTSQYLPPRFIGKDEYDDIAG
jgi:hypothetical protein